MIYGIVHISIFNCIGSDFGQVVVENITCQLFPNPKKIYQKILLMNISYTNCILIINIYDKDFGLKFLT